MKTYIVRFSEKVCRKCVGDKFNKQTRKWEYDVPMEEWAECFEMHSLSEAKKLIKDNMGVYIGSAIYKTWANGDFENLGSINVAGSNKTFTANTRQMKLGY